jgi:hypothetical protein
VVADPDLAVDRDGRAVARRHLLGHDRVGAVGHRRAGRDPHGGPAPDADARLGAGLRLPDELELGRPLERVGGADREAVHRRGGERRHVVGCAGVERERATQRVVEEDVLGVEHVGVLEDRDAGFVDGDGHAQTLDRVVRGDARRRRETPASGSMFCCGDEF